MNTYLFAYVASAFSIIIIIYLYWSIIRKSTLKWRPLKLVALSIIAVTATIIVFVPLVKDIPFLMMNNYKTVEGIVVGRSNGKIPITIRIIDDNGAIVAISTNNTKDIQLGDRVIAEYLPNTKLAEIIKSNGASDTVAAAVAVAEYDESLRPIFSEPE